MPVVILLGIGELTLIKIFEIITAIERDNQDFVSRYCHGDICQAFETSHQNLLPTRFRIHWFNFKISYLFTNKNGF